MHPSIGCIHCCARSASPALLLRMKPHIPSWPSQMTRLWGHACSGIGMTAACAGSIKGSARCRQALRPGKCPCTARAGIAVARTGLEMRQHVPMARYHNGQYTSGVSCHSLLLVLPRSHRRTALLRLRQFKRQLCLGTGAGECEMRSAQLGSSPATHYLLVTQRAAMRGDDMQS